MSPLRVAFENYVPRAGFFDSDLGLVRAGLAVKENQLCSNQSEGPRNLFRGAQAPSLQVSAPCRDSLQRLKIDAPVIECCRQAAGNCGLAARAPQIRPPRRAKFLNPACVRSASYWKL